MTHGELTVRGTPARIGPDGWTSTDSLLEQSLNFAFPVGSGEAGGTPFVRTFWEAAAALKAHARVTTEPQGSPAGPNMTPAGTQAAPSTPPAA